jgi:hypothetical protein
MPLDRREFLLSLTAAGLAQAASSVGDGGWRAGLAVVDITPAPGIWMAGYAARKDAAQGTLQPLHAKALALDDGGGDPVVIVTMDVLGLTAPVMDRIAAAVSREHGVPRHGLIVCSSHTHSGPVIDDQLAVAYDLTPQQWQQITASTRRIEGLVVDVVGKALRARGPARLRTAQGTATFAANRRTQFTPDGPVDHAVPVLSIERPDGTRIGLLFGYACHNTTLPAEMVQWHGDYAGVAQVELERRHAGVTAMYVAGCGADANPKPRGTLALVEQHGRSLADAVDAVLDRATPVTGPLRAAFGTASLAYAPAPEPETWKAKLTGENVYEQRHARLMLDTLARGETLPAAEPAPVHVVRLGSLTFVTLSGEVVVDYALAIKRTYGDRVWVAGYTDTVFGYVPSRRVLAEGGYEGGGAMLYYGRPGPFADSVEASLLGQVDALMTSTAR